MSAVDGYPVLPPVASMEDNARLRALIKDAEWADTRQNPACPWCEVEKVIGKHTAGCRAFFRNGAVK